MKEGAAVSTTNSRTHLPPAQNISRKTQLKRLPIKVLFKNPIPSHRQRAVSFRGGFRPSDNPRDQPPIGSSFTIDELLPTYRLRLHSIFSLQFQFSNPLSGR